MRSDLYRLLILGESSSEPALLSPPYEHIVSHAKIGLSISCEEGVRALVLVESVQQANGLRCARISRS